jgi:hypothetical protein
MPEPARYRSVPCRDGARAEARLEFTGERRGGHVERHVMPIVARPPAPGNPARGIASMRGRH